MRLADAQATVAGERGFSSWSELVGAARPDRHRWGSDPGSGLLRRASAQAQM